MPICLWSVSYLFSIHFARLLYVFVFCIHIYTQRYCLLRTWIFRFPFFFFKHNYEMPRGVFNGQMNATHEAYKPGKVCTSLFFFILVLISNEKYCIVAIAWLRNWFTCIFTRGLTTRAQYIRWRVTETFVITILYDVNNFKWFLHSQQRLTTFLVVENNDKECWNNLVVFY